MGFADNGVYTAPAGATNAIPGAVIASATWNSIHTDLQTALTALGRGCPFVLGSSAVAFSHTGNTTETNLALVGIPAGALGLNGLLCITLFYGGTNNANNKTLRVKIGSTAFSTTIFTTAVGITQLVYIYNRNSASVQIGGTIGTSGAFTTGAIDTTVAQNVFVTGQLAVGTDTITLEAYTIEIFRRA